MRVILVLMKIKRYRHTIYIHRYTIDIFLLMKIERHRNAIYINRYTINIHKYTIQTCGCLVIVKSMKDSKITSHRLTNII